MEKNEDNKRERLLRRLRTVVLDLERIASEAEYAARRAREVMTMTELEIDDELP